MLTAPNSNPQTILSSKPNIDSQSTQPTFAPHATPGKETAIVPLIVGGGPCGLLAAATLHQNGIPCVLLEQARDTTSDPSRAYPITVIQRSRNFLSHLPLLLDALCSKGNVLNDKQRQIVEEDGTVNRIATWGKRTHEPSMSFLRGHLVQTLRDYVQDHCPSVSSYYGYRGIQLQFDDEGIIVQTSADDSKLMFRANILIVCEGRNSTTVHQLRIEEEAGLVNTTSGFNYIKKNSATSSLLRKTIITSPNFTKRFFPDESYPGRITLYGSTKGRTSNRVFSMSAFRLPLGHEELQFRSIASIVLHQDHALWQVDSPRKLYEFVQENFPHTNVTDLIDDFSVKQFLEARTSQYGPVRAIRSLTGTATKSGDGIIVMGDAAHSFPPDLGQGLCAAWEDDSPSWRGILLHSVQA
ncbi:hypothetical protein BWQ96_04094 [Gracilariopsis chorda]|uniref:FAD-binding domain-containing protein n=1 Tax=Gracilariopsis chorda TaxID=448386 RepID=A0A2V3IVB5_9FLOR|nr:hypothetical protein BWQ96_04094 [Gracilariopsis chorda]|eukprot:PXF46088.1 hypothetical protein BWQ96_04094 [Gracilariopsis chorda]